MEIRRFDEADRAQVWPILRDIVRAGETFTYDPAMQFNTVAASNQAAVELYERLGFEIVGTVPGAFAHPTLGRVGLHVMYRAL